MKTTLILGLAVIAQPFLVSQPIVEIAEPKKVEIVEFQSFSKLEAIPLPDVRSKPVKAVSVKGDKYTWLRAAGIPESDWTYVDYIIQKESGWNPSAKNRSSGACGLVQALPCSKLGSNWSDPVVALRWGDSYAHQRYGSWYQAYQFWLKNHYW